MSPNPGPTATKARPSLKSPAAFELGLDYKLRISIDIAEAAAGADHCPAIVEIASDVKLRIDDQLARLVDIATPIADAHSRQPQSAPQQPLADPNSGGPYATGGRETWRARHERHHRSKKHSIEIVAGTAAAGAAIGAIAGGGPGAAIGAISGAGAGFTYDRLTHNH